MSAQCSLGVGGQARPRLPCGVANPWISGVTWTLLSGPRIDIAGWTTQPAGYHSVAQSACDVSFAPSPSCFQIRKSAMGGGGEYL